MQLRETTIHGRRLAYRTAGDTGPPVLLIHGITQEASTWEPLAAELAHQVRVVALDLPGHGRSQNPPGDHSLGAYASTVRDLLVVLDEPAVTVVGHSLGGGIGLQFAYQFPEMVERMVLVGAGGLGSEVSVLLRAASLPGAELVLALLTSDRTRRGAEAVAARLSSLGLRASTDLTGVWRGLHGLADPEARRAFLATVRATIGLRGQRISATDKLYLAGHVPTLLIWGARDRIIPLAHATEAHELIPGSVLRVLRKAGHFPHLDAPEVVAEHILDFIAATEAARLAREQWGAILRSTQEPKS